MSRLAQQLGLILLICVGVRIGAELVEPAMPLLVTFGMVAGIGWLLGRSRSRGYR